MVSTPERPVDVKSSLFAAQYPFASHFLRLPSGIQLHYLDEGPRDGPVLLFLHGNPTWSFIWRHAILALRDRFRCIAIDHMGCGLSDRPQDWAYTLSNHAANVGALISHLDVDKLSLVMHDWGGMIGMTFATQNPNKIRALAAMNTAAFHGRLPPSIAAVRVPFFGPMAVLRGNAFVRAALRLNTRAPLDEATTAGYLAPYQTPHDRIATLRFVQDVPQSRRHPTWKVVDDVDGKLSLFKNHPVKLIWGEKDFCFTPKFRRGWQERFPHADCTIYDDAHHYIFEDEADNVVRDLAVFFDEVYQNG